MIKAVLFDLDGTLLNTLDDLADSMNTVLKRFGFPQHPVEAYRYLVGDGIVNLVSQALPDQYRDETTINRIVSVDREEYARNWSNKTRPYEGIPDLLNALQNRGIAICVLSNKPDEFTQIIVKRFLPNWKFAVVRGANDETPIKPDPAGALQH